MGGSEFAAGKLLHIAFFLWYVGYMAQIAKGGWLRTLSLFPFIYGLACFMIWALNEYGIEIHIPVPLPSTWLLSIVGSVYYFFFLKYAENKIGRFNAYIVGFALSLLPVSIAITESGRYDSSQQIVWTYLTFLSGMLGPSVPITMAGLSALSYILASLGTVGMEVSTFSFLIPIN